MPDKLEWMNRHSVLLRNQEWRPIAEAENYKIRPDLQPIFDGNSDALGVLEEMGRRALFAEACEFIARMTHRRAAIWWGYQCLLTLLEERREVLEKGVNPVTTELDKSFVDLSKAIGVKMPTPTEAKAILAKDPTALAGMVKDLPGPNSVEELRKLADFAPLPPQDKSAINAASEAVKGGIDRLNALIPDVTKQIYERCHAIVENEYRKVYGVSPAEAFKAANERAVASPLTYEIKRFASPQTKALLDMRKELVKNGDDTIDQIKDSFPEKFPKTPEAAKLLELADRKRSDDAVQAVYRWVVSPDEVNTQLAMECGNKATMKPEGMLALATFWSFGDLMPAGKAVIPVPPELPGTGLKSAILMMAMEPGGTRKKNERLELYYNLGMDVIFARNLWPETVEKIKSPHEEINSKPMEPAHNQPRQNAQTYSKWNPKG